MSSGCTVVFETERLTVRTATVEDLDLFYLLPEFWGAQVRRRSLA